MFKRVELDLGATTFIVTYHTALAILLPLYLFNHTPSLLLIGLSVFLFFATGMGVTIAYHRYYSHRSYELHPFAELIVLFFATCAAQASAIRWSFEHRLHHRYVDQEKDPYNVKMGFWHAHIIWLFLPKKTIDFSVIPDLAQKKLLQFQHKHYSALFFTGNMIIVAGVGSIIHDFYGAFVIAFLLRLFLVHHCTWFINSWAHTFGSKTFSHEHSAVNNAFLALFTFGEGYHNYHHTFASDYRNGVRWWQFDPTKWTIFLLSLVGLAYNLKRINQYTIQRKQIEEQTRMLLEKQQNHFLQDTLLSITERMRQRLIALNQLVNSYYASHKLERKTIRQEIKTLQDAVNEEYKQWKQMCKVIQASITPA